jgi:hypothetical protein
MVWGQAVHKRVPVVLSQKVQLIGQRPHWLDVIIYLPAPQIEQLLLVAWERSPTQDRHDVGEWEY